MDNEVATLANSLYEAVTHLLSLPTCKIIAEDVIKLGYREQKEGTWIKAPCSEKDGDANCSECNHWDWSDRNFCSNCGAKMRNTNRDLFKTEPCAKEFNIKVEVREETQ